jgi:hypothetical protein
MPVKQYFVTLLKLTALGIAGIGCAAILYTIVSLVASPESRGRALRLLGLERLAAVFGPDRFSQGPASPGSLPKGFQDLLIVERDNEAIYTWVLTCVGIDSSDVAPSSIHYEMMLPTERLLGYRTYTDVSSDENKNKKLEQVEHALIQLNKNIAEQRLSLMSRGSIFIFISRDDYADINSDRNGHDVIGQYKLDRIWSRGWTQPTTHTHISYCLPSCGDRGRRDHWLLQSAGGMGSGKPHAS